MLPPRKCAGLLLLLVLLGCTAEGTDLDGYPFVNIDETEPGVDHVTVPVALMSYDTGHPRRIVRGPSGGPIDKPKNGGELQASRLQILFPVITLEEENREHELKIFAPIIAPFTAGFTSLAGPAGRALSGTTPVVAQPSKLFGVTSKTASPFASYPAIAFDREHVDPEYPSETKRDFGLFPLFLGGDWPQKGGYLVIAPFGGTTYGFLGKDEMTWVGFPYPLYLYSRERDVESRTILWPLINWVNGGGREGFRVWPFYAHYRRTDILGREAYDRHWVMWPFVSWSRNSGQIGSYDEETDDFRATPTEELFIFPFFGRIVGPDDKNYSVLWPFFRYEEIPSTNFWELRAPFPFFTMHHGSDPALARLGKNSERIRFDIWPIFGVKQRPGYRRYFGAWPIYRYEFRDDEWVTDTKLYFVPIVEWHHHHEKESTREFPDGQDYQRTRIWPFFIYRRGVRNDIEFHTLAPILWDDPNGFERIIYPFLRLYEYKRSSVGATQHRFLLGVASWRHEPAVPDEARGGFARYEYTRLSVLFGLFQYRSGGTTREESGRTGFRVFYLPEISWGGGG
jgi:hypothetical protein